MTVKTSPRRKRSTFKKQAGSYVTLKPRFQLHTKPNGESEIVEKRRRSGGLGYLNNRCTCRSCKGMI